MDSDFISFLVCVNQSSFPYQLWPKVTYDHDDAHTVDVRMDAIHDKPLVHSMAEQDWYDYKIWTSNSSGRSCHELILRFWNTDSLDFVFANVELIVNSYGGNKPNITQPWYFNVTLLQPSPTISQTTTSSDFKTSCFVTPCEWTSITLNDLTSSISCSNYTLILTGTTTVNYTVMITATPQVSISDTRPITNIEATPNTSIDLTPINFGTQCGNLQTTTTAVTVVLGAALSCTVLVIITLSVTLFRERKTHSKYSTREREISDTAYKNNEIVELDCAAQKSNQISHHTSPEFHTNHACIVSPFCDIDEPEEAVCNIFMNEADDNDLEQRNGELHGHGGST